VGCAKCINVYRDAAAMGNLLFVSRSAQPASSTTTQFDSLHSRALLMLNTLLSLSRISTGTLLLYCCCQVQKLKVSAQNWFCAGPTRNKRGEGSLLSFGLERGPLVDSYSLSECV
jgi:hypothetical protein